MDGVMKNQELAERWIKGFEEGFGRKPTPEEEQRIRERADEADPNNPGALVWPRDPNMKWPTADEYRQQMLNRMRGMWAQIGERCAEAGEPEPDPAQLAAWEAQYSNSGASEWTEEMVRVSVAWTEARESGDPTALKCEAEFVDSTANREREGWEHLDTMKKWYVANCGELKSPIWEKIAAQRSLSSIPAISARLRRVRPFLFNPVQKNFAFSIAVFTAYFCRTRLVRIQLGQLSKSAQQNKDIVIRKSFRMCVVLCD